MTEQLAELAATAEDWPLRVLEDLAWRHVAAHRECIGWTMSSGGLARTWCGNCGWRASPMPSDSPEAVGTFGLGALARFGVHVAWTYRIATDEQLAAQWRKLQELDAG